MLKTGQLDVARFDSEADDAYAAAAAAALAKGGNNKGSKCDAPASEQDPQGENCAAPSAVAAGPSAFALLRRAAYLLYLFSAAIVTAVLALVSESFRSPYWYRMLACAISRAGAAFIKWGQWASARPDIFPVRTYFGVLGGLGCIGSIPPPPPGQSFKNKT